jgi:hypothetical protein
MPLTDYGKRGVASLMYDRARGFAGASALLGKVGGEGLAYVQLHLLCQSIEIALKAVLLRLNYDKYRPKLRMFGHDLPALVKEVSLAVGRNKQLSAALGKELAVVGTLYASQRLRYASDFDLFVNPHTIPTRRVEFAFLAMIKLIDDRGLFRMPS